MRQVAWAAVAIMAAAQGVWAQEIGRVTIQPNAQTGIMYADLPTRPDGEAVYILRKGELVTPATIISSGQQGGTVISVPTNSAAKVKEGDRISLTPAAEELPLAHYQPMDSPRRSAAQEGAVSGGADGFGAPGGTGVEAVAPGNMALATGEMSVEASMMAPRLVVRPRLTPRGSTVYPYPRPAVEPVPAGGPLGPYGQGLAAAAPVGTPYLRSPAFAGPPIIYQPQAVTRVLVPGITPYPYQTLPTSTYGYSSAPFLRTDIYVDLPYGTFYWPQGYAGTVPVEPQVPIYAVAPSTAIMSDEASYNVQRYDYTLDDTGAAVVSADLAMVSTDVGAGPAVVAVVPGAPSASVAMEVIAEPPPAPITTLAPVVTPVAGTLVPLAELPSIPADAPAPGPFTPTSPGLSPLPGVQPPPAVPAPAPEVEPGAIIIDDRTPSGLVLDPPTGWQPSVNVADSYDMSSLVTTIATDPKTATFVGDIAEAGEYEVSLWWVASGTQFRSTAVPVTVNTADGPVQTTVDQTAGSRQFNVVGRYKFNAGEKQQILSISTTGLEPGPTMNISVDAVKLVKVQ